MGRPSPAIVVGGARCSLKAFQSPKRFRNVQAMSLGGEVNAIAPGRRVESMSVSPIESMLKTELKIAEGFPGSSQTHRTNHSSLRVGEYGPYRVPLEEEKVEETEKHRLSATQNATPASAEYNRWRPYNPTDPSSSTGLFRRRAMERRELRLKEPLYHELQAYTLHFKRSLDAEVDEAGGRVRDRQAHWPLDRLVEEGYTLISLSAYEYIQPGERKHDGHTFSFVPPAGETLGVNLFLRGSQVTIVPDGTYPLSSSNKDANRGIVLYSNPDEIRIKFSERLSQSETTQQWRMDVCASDIGRQRMLTAIQALNYNPADMEAASSWKEEYELDGTYLRDEILDGWDQCGPASLSPEDGTRVAPNNAAPTGLFTSDERIRDWVRRYSLPIPERQEGDPELDLNTSQIHAIAQMIRERFSLVQGPPGTGKTRTIIETIKILKAHFKVPIPLLICTYTNAAVDNLVEGIAAAGLEPLRIGSESSVREDFAKWSLNSRMKRHPQWEKLVDLKFEEQKIAREISSSEKRGDSSVSFEQTTRRSEHLSHIKKAIQTLRKSMQYHILRSADVICTTCLTAGSRTLRLMDFPAVFLDEASMSTEPASLIPLMRGSQHVALIGDHKQLPPVITSDVARIGGLSRSLFERCMDKKKLPSVMLNTQYRMHPSISAFPSREFYDRALENGTAQADLLPPRSRHLSRRKSKVTGQVPSVLFIHHDNYEVAKDRSRANIQELYIVIAILEDLLISNPEMQGKDIGIIAPYVAQIRMLEAILNSDLRWEQSFCEKLGDRRALQMKEIEVKTVDGFEGREKEVIIFSTVRNNSYGQIGFLADRRRMNVALTRAKRALFIVGSMATLAQGRYGAGGEEPENDVAKMMVHGTGDEWKKFIQFVHAEELFTEYDRPLEYRSAEEVLEFDRISRMPVLWQGQSLWNT